jgi:hypothetical protein
MLYDAEAVDVNVEVCDDDTLFSIVGDVVVECLGLSECKVYM